MKIFFMDKTNSHRLYPEDTVMVGDPVIIDLGAGSPQILGYKTHIFRSKILKVIQVLIVLTILPTTPTMIASQTK